MVHYNLDNECKKVISPIEKIEMIIVKMQAYEISPAGIWIVDEQFSILI